MAITDQQYDTLAQYNHVLFGAMAVLLPKAFCPDPNAIWWTAGIFIAYALIKEFWYDEIYESPEIRGSNLRDFIFYAIGVVAGLILVLVSRWMM